MKIGISAPSSSRPLGAYPGCLVDIEQGAAEEEQRTEDEIAEENGDALAVVALAVEQRAQHARRDADDDHERGERAERVHVVGGAERPAADERVAEAEPLDHRRG